MRVEFRETGVRPNWAAAARAVALARQLEFGPWTALKGRLWRFPATNYPRTADQRAPIVDRKTLSRPMSLYVVRRETGKE